MNFLFILFIIILINFSGKTDIEIIDEMLQYQDEHGPVPAVKLEGSFDMQKDEPFEFPENKNEEIIYVQRVIKVISSTPGYRIRIHFVDDEIWTSIAENNEIKILYLKNDYINSSELTEINLTFINQTIEFQENEISLANALPSILIRSVQFGLIEFIMPQSVINDKILVTTQNFGFVEYLYFKNEYLQSVSKIKDIEVQTLIIFDDEYLNLSELDEIYVEYRIEEYGFNVVSTPFISLLKKMEMDSYDDLSAILFSSGVKIIFIENIFILGYHILLKNKIKFVELEYYRGKSINTIKKKLIFNEIKNIGIVSILSSSIIFSLEWTEFQQSIFALLIGPWLILYLLYSSYVINYHIRMFRRRIALISVLDSKKIKTTYKLFGITSIVLGILALINIISYRESIFQSLFLVYLYWSLTFLIIFIFILLIEKDLLKNKVNKFSSGNLLLPKICKNRFIFLILLIMIAGNTTINQEVNSDLVRTENYDLIRGNMGDFTIRNIPGYIDIFNFSELNEIENIQSILPIYRITTKLFDETNSAIGIYETDNQLQLGAKLVNQTLYDNFTIKDNDEIDKDKFFGDKIWVPKNYIGPFKYRTNINLNVAGKYYPLISDNFNVLEDKAGILEWGSNSILSSIETWKKLNLPFEDLELGTELDLDSIILSFVDNIDPETAKIRVANAFNLNADDDQLFLSENEVIIRENSFDKTATMNLLINIIFSLAMGFTFFYFLFDEKIFESLLYYLTKYGVNKSKNLFIEIIVFSSFIGLVFVFIGSFSSFIGTTHSIRRFNILNFEWGNMWNFAFFSILPQIAAQLLYSLYLTKKIKKIVNK